MRAIITALLLLTLSLNANAQGRPGGGHNGPGVKFDGPAIFGKIMDVNNKAVPYASVVVFNTSDSVMVTGAATDTNGRFKIFPKPGGYYLKISFLSYMDVYISDVKVEDKPFKVGRVIMEENSELMD